MHTNFNTYLNESKEVAHNIIATLGGNRFAAMNGATFFTTEKGLKVKFKGSRKSNMMTIELNSMDTYDVNFYKTVKYDFKEVESFEDVYASQLRDIFTRVTGLYTSL